MRVKQSLPHFILTPHWWKVFFDDVNYHKWSQTVAAVPNNYKLNKNQKATSETKASRLYLKIKIELQQCTDFGVYCGMKCDVQNSVYIYLSIYFTLLILMY